MVELTIAVAAFIGGWVVSFLVLKNNPKLLNLSKLSRDILIELAEKIRIELKS